MIQLFLGGYIDGYWNEIENLRMLKNLTQEELAERTDLTKGYISQIESQHASPVWNISKYIRSFRYAAK